MNAEAYLLRHGWSGPGNPLNPNLARRARGPHDGLGLTKPLLAAKRQGNHGVGKKTTKDATNQWWLRGFEDALKGVGEGGENSGNGSGYTGSSVRPNALTSELYRFFVRGEVVPGTLGDRNGSRDKSGDGVGGSGGGKKRKLDGDGDEEGHGDGNKDEERGMKKKAKKVKGGEGDGKAESKEERRARKMEKKMRKEEKERKRTERKEKKICRPVPAIRKNLDGRL